MSTENVPLLTRELAERTTVIQVYDGNGLSVLTVAARAALNAIQDGRAVVIDADELAALRKFDESVGKLENCSDRHCVIRPNAVGTNGGCKCWDDRHKARLMFAYVKRLRAALAANGEKS